MASLYKCGTPLPARQCLYDNVQTDLQSTNVQAAVDEIAGKLSVLKINPDAAFKAIPGAIWIETPQE